MELYILDVIQGVRTPMMDAAMMFVSRLGDSGLVWIVLTLILLVI
jgi:hypothetical protein